MAISAAASTLAALADAYKELFPDRRLEQLALMDRDIMRWLPKADDLEGDGIWIPMRYGAPQGLSTDFAGGQANVTSGLVKKAYIQRNRYYGFVALDDEAVRAARSRKGAFYGVKEVEIEDMIQAVAQELETHLWRDGSGTKGVISSITAAVPSVITLTNPEDVANFAVGEVLEARDSAGSTDRGGDEAITAVDPDAGTITMTTDVATDHSWAATDILIRGTVGAVASDYNGVVNGLGAWIPATAETSGTFLNMDRTDDIVRLQGFRQSYLGSIEETVKKLRSKMGRYGARPDSVWLSHDNWHRLEIELGARAIREDGMAATFGLPSLKYASPKGVMRIFAGAFCEENVGYLLKRDTWKLHHLDGLPHIVMSDGLRATRGQDYDGIEVRARYWAELACDAPKHNGRFVIS
jgi:hypothetical protein